MAAHKCSNCPVQKPTQAACGCVCVSHRPKSARQPGQANFTTFCFKKCSRREDPIVHILEPVLSSKVPGLSRNTERATSCDCESHSTTEAPVLYSDWEDEPWDSVQRPYAPTSCDRRELCCMYQTCHAELAREERAVHCSASHALHPGCEGASALHSSLWSGAAARSRQQAVTAFLSMMRPTDVCSCRKTSEEHEEVKVRTSALETWCRFVGG